MQTEALNPETYIKQVALKARQASRQLAAADSGLKTQALQEMAESLEKHREQIKAANSIDLEESRRQNLSPALLDRLELTDPRIDSMVKSLEDIARLSDPVGEVVAQWQRPGGLEVGQVRIPLGVIAIIYESRPNVTADAAGLCFKAGNAVILRGGSEALQSNLAIARALREALRRSGLEADMVQTVAVTDRRVVTELLKLQDLIDLVIPRGGKGLIKTIVENSTIPVIKHYEGICHIFVHRDADLNTARKIVLNAKVQRPATCNAMETLLVDSPLASRFLPALQDSFREQGVEIRGCPRTAELIQVDSQATEEDYRTEYLDLICNIRIVEDLEEAIRHIQTYGSRHTDGIVTRSLETSRRFVREVDSSSVMVNASTRLADGGIYGLGAEIGISTDKLHAYGPMGVKELTTKKFVVFGQGTVRK